jgi:hypothetical protein
MHDMDGDGIYDNSQGTGWVESWPSGMLHQEIYLALLDQQASGAVARLRRAAEDRRKRRPRGSGRYLADINSEYRDAEKGCCRVQPQ